MGLRDAIRDGHEEIRRTAQLLIEGLNIEEKIREATVRHKTSITVDFEKGVNQFVIQEEVIQQIESEGFEVEYKKPCCPSPNYDFLRHDTEWNDYGYPTKSYYNYYCESCSFETTGIEEAEFLQNPAWHFCKYGSITINWENYNKQG